jgi:hypothetical protein
MPTTVPAAQEIVVRMTNAIEAAGTQKGLLYAGIVENAVLVDGRPAIPAGSAVEIEVADFAKPGRLKSSGKLDLALRNLTIKGRRYPVESDVYELTASSKARRAGKFGVLGAVAHGVKGAVGAGGSGAASATAELDVAAQTLLNFHLTAPLTLSAR